MKNPSSEWFKILLVFSVVFVFSSFNLNAQSTSDSLVKPSKEFKNTIRFNITNPLIFGKKSIIFGYERVLKNNQSFSINIGQASLSPFSFFDDSELKAKSILNEEGFNISGDYRFYLTKLNKYNAPRGVYIGPYYSFNTFRKEHRWEFTKDGVEAPVSIDSDLKIDIHTVGFELGYQFVFWKRFSVDMILLGPGVAAYKLKSEIGGNLSEEDKQKFFEKLNEALEDEFPGYSGTIGSGSNEGEFEKSGRRNTTGLGYRYMVQIGYRF
ncbi:MAG TPA: hypothetical protein VIV55_14075 [Flavobacterium sp.]